MDTKKVENAVYLEILKELKNILFELGKMAGIGLVFVDLREGKEWVADPIDFNIMNEFCDIIRETPTGRERCRRSDYENAKALVADRKSRIYKCHAGLWEFGVPLILAHKTAGAICGGQFLPVECENSSFERLADELSLDKTRFLNATNKLRLVSKDELETIVSSIDSITKRLVLSAEKQRAVEEGIRIKGLMESNNFHSQEVLNLIRDRCKKLVGGASHGCILRRDPKTGTPINIAPCNKGKKKGCKGEEAGGLIEWVIKNKKAILIPDAQKDSRYDKKKGWKETRSKIVVPIFDKKGVIGAINLTSNCPEFFEVKDMELIQLIAPQVSMAIRASEQIDTLRSLYEIGLSLTMAHDSSEVLREISKRAKEILYADVVVLYQYEQDKGEFQHPPIIEGEIYNKNELIFPGEEDNVVKRISQLKAPHFADNAVGDTIMEHKFVEREKIVSSCGVPLMVEENLVGILFVNFRKFHHFTENESNLISMFGTLAAVAINRVQMQRKGHQEKLAALGKQAAELAHRIVTPLGIIGATVQNLKKEDELEKEGFKKALDKILGNVERIATLNNRILKFSRLSKKIERVNINQEILRTFNLLKDEGIMKEGIITQEKFDDIPELLLDSEDIREVFISVISNSINAMPLGGILRIKTQYLEEKQKVTIVIEDTGYGIPKDKWDKIFEPFETTTVSGTGLGLSISYQIIKEYNGDIKVESKEGEWTRFTITLPVNEKTRGEGLMGYASRFFSGIVGNKVDVDRIREIKKIFEGALDNTNNYIKSVLKDIEKRLTNDLEIAKDIFYNKGKEVRIVGGKMVIGQEYIVNDTFEIVDEISKKLPGAKATVFQLIGNEAVRISTNEKNEDGSRAINTVVSKPVYQRVIREGKSFSGRAWVITQWKITRYEPIYDVNGKVIGMLYISIPDTHPQIVEDLEKSISSIRFGNNGYVFILEGKGKIVFHPHLLPGFDFSTYRFYQDEIQRKMGWLDVSYQSMNGLRQEIIHYHQFVDWNWLLCAASPKEDILRFLKR